MNLLFPLLLFFQYFYLQPQEGSCHFETRHQGDKKL